MGILSKIYYMIMDANSASKKLIMGLNWVREHDVDLFIYLKSLSTSSNITDTHRLVAVDRELNLEVLFRNYQGENWSPNGEARELIQALGVRHTSMSVGDIIQQDDKFFFCDNTGWQKL